MENLSFEEWVNTLPVPKSRKEPQISSRRYTITVTKESGEIAEKVEDIALRTARDIRDWWNSNYEKLSIVIEEIETIDYADREIIFSPRREIPVVAGICNFGTPAATDRKIEDQRAKMHEKNIRNAKSKKSAETRVYGTNGEDKNSLLHKEWEKAFAKAGYEIRFKDTGTLIFRGLKIEGIAFLLDIVNNQGVNKNELDIKRVGSVK